ncbi:MAG: hypothetical protein GF398_16655 [Chitinivibrionales bacterium]|nr:hypothetical protein [Chitinivibrionales bacterium]
MTAINPRKQLPEPCERIAFAQSNGGTVLRWRISHNGPADIRLRTISGRIVYRLRKWLEQAAIRKRLRRVLSLPVHICAA